MKDAENKFIKFLEEKGALEEYKANLEAAEGFDNPKEWLESVNPSDYTNSAFSWGHASEWKKWCALNEEWQDFIKQEGAE